jgi:phage I-like protein
VPRLAAQSHTFFLREPKLLLAELPVVDDAAEAAAANLAKVPDWVNVLPAPDAEGKIFSRDGRVLNIDNLEKLAARSNKALKKQKGGGPVDKDHELYGGWFTTGGGPAVGWAEEFEARPSGLFAKVDWLPEAKDLISARKYRYTSAVVFGEHEWDRDGEGYPSTLQIYPDLVEGFAITNIPALQVTSMFSAHGDPLRDETIRVLLQKLGIPADALAADIRAAHKRLAIRGVFSIGASSGEPAHNDEKPTTPPAGEPPPLPKNDDEPAPAPAAPAHGCPRATL